MKVRFSRQARRDLASITETIAKDNPPRSATFADELEEASLALSTMSMAYEVLGTRNGQQLRRKPHGNYVILYRVTEQHVDILRIVHGARNYLRMLDRK